MTHLRCKIASYQTTEGFTRYYYTGELEEYTEEMFDLFNEHFYENELTHPVITVSPNGGHNAYSWCSIDEIWNANDEKYREINLCAEYLDSPIFELAATLIEVLSSAGCWLG